MEKGIKRSSQTMKQTRRSVLDCVFVLQAAAKLKPKLSVSSSASNSSSNASLPAAARSSPPPPQVNIRQLPPVEPSCRSEPWFWPLVCLQVDRASELEPASASLALSVSLAQAKERAHQKRAAKKAPAMDWSKRNELFSNLWGGAGPLCAAPQWRIQRQSASAAASHPFLHASTPVWQYYIMILCF